MSTKPRTYDLRYFSPMLNASALYGNFPTYDEAAKAREILETSVRRSGMEPKEKVQLIKGIEII